MSPNSVKSKKATVKVLVVDDHTLFAEGTVALLSSEQSISVVGIAKNGQECLELAARTFPDVILLDIKLPDINGTDLLSKIKKVQSEAKVIMLTGQSPKGYVTKSISMGAQGFLLKDCTVNEIIWGIYKVFKGGTYFPHSLEVVSCGQENGNYSINPELPSKPLSPKEIEVMELVSQGLRSKEIALALGINVRTVDFHVNNILIKLNVKTRLEAVLKYKDEGVRDC